MLEIPALQRWGQRYQKIKVIVSQVNTEWEASLGYGSLAEEGVRLRGEEEGGRRKESVHSTHSFKPYSDKQVSTLEYFLSKLKALPSGLRLLSS